MASNAKIVLRKKPNNLGLYPLTIRITKDRRSTYRYIGHYIESEDWDDINKLVKISHPNYQFLNQLIYTKLNEANRGLIALQSKDDDITAALIKREIYNSSKNLTFFEIANEHLEELEASHKFNRLSSEKALVGYILKFNKTNQLTFKEIDESFLKKLKVYLIKEYSLSETSIMNVFVFIRTLYNKAIKEKIVKKKLYPFGNDKIRIKFPESKKIGLTKTEILSIESLENLTYGEIHARNIWLYSFNFAGMRVADILKTRWDDIKDNRLYYRMNKNSKLLSLKIPEKVLLILDFYRDAKRWPDDYVFPELKKANSRDPEDLFRKSKTANKKFNYYLKSIAKKAGINKPLTMHIARHSFGNIAGDTIHPLMLQKLYRHSDLKTTLNYQANFIHKEADEALENVINF
jgi:integrase